MHKKAQLDCIDPKKKEEEAVFDLKTRAVLPIRMDCANHHEYTNYHITQATGTTPFLGPVQSLGASSIFLGCACQFDRDRLICIPLPCTLGEYWSYEREFFDMVRSSMLK